MLIVVGELLEVLLENGLKHVRSALAVRRGLIRIEGQRELCLHMKIQLVDAAWCFPSEENSARFSGDV